MSGGLLLVLLAVCPGGLGISRPLQHANHGRGRLWPGAQHGKEVRSRGLEKGRAIGFSSKTPRIVSLEGCGLLSRGLSSATEGGPITGLV